MVNQKDGKPRIRVVGRQGGKTDRRKEGWIGRRNYERDENRKDGEQIGRTDGRSVGRTVSWEDVRKVERTDSR